LFFSLDFTQEHLLIEAAEQVQELPALLCVKWCNQFFTQVQLKATDLLELGVRLLSEFEQRCTPVSRVRQAGQQPLSFESVDQRGDRAGSNSQVFGQSPMRRRPTASTASSRRRRGPESLAAAFCLPKRALNTRWRRWEVAIKVMTTSDAVGAGSASWL
jgi:hypothetical protein